MNPDKFYGTNGCKLAYAFEKLLRVTGTTPDLTPAEFNARLMELKAQRQLLEKSIPKEPSGPVALDADFRPVMAMMGQLGLAGGISSGGVGGGGIASANTSSQLEEGWTTRVAETVQGEGGGGGGGRMDTSE